MPDDETVNQMLARTEEEFDLYQVSIHGCNDFFIILITSCYNETIFCLPIIAEKKGKKYQY